MKPAFFIVLFLFWGNLTFSQNYPIQVYSTNDGLPDMNINTIFRDSRNYLWLGTGYGFSKFDGQKFTNFHLPPKIAGDNTLQIIEAKNGELIISSSRNLYKFDGKTVSNLKAKGGYYNEIAFDNEDNFYASYEGKVLFTKSLNDSLKLLDWPVLKGKNVRNFTYIPEAGKYFAQFMGIGIVQLTKNQFEILAPIKNERGSIEYRFGPKKERYLFFESDNSSKFYLLEKSGSLKKILEVNPNKHIILNTASFDLFFSNEESSYLLKANSKEIVKIETGGQAPGNQFCYSGTNIFVGSNHGLLKIINNGIQHFTNSQVPACWSVIENKKKQIWFWNTDFPTQIYDGKQIRTISGDFEIAKKEIARVFPQEIYYPSRVGWYGGVLNDKYDAIWKAHSFGVLREQNEKFKFFALPDEDHIYASFAVLEDSVNNRIIKGGVKNLHFINNKPPFKVKTISNKDGLHIKTSVYSLALESPGIYWIGSTNKLVLYNTIKNTFKEYSNENKKFLASDILDLTFDHTKTLWLATASKGLQYFNRKLGKVVPIEVPEFQEPVLFIGQVNNQYLLIGSYVQLYLFDVAEWHKSKGVLFKAFNKNNGYLGMQPNQEGFLKDSQGKIWVTSSLLTTIDPAKLHLQNDTLQTFFTKFNGVTLPFHYQNLTLKTNGSFRAEFEAVGENRAQDTQYSYFLEGFSKEWSPWFTEPVVTINSLASGKYTLQVRSRTGNGDLRFSKATSLSFRVAVMPWASPYFPFYVLLGLVGLGLGFYFYRLQQKRKARQTKRALAQQEQQLLFKEIEARELHLNVQALQVQTAQAQMNPHFTFNTINAIKGLIATDANAANENLTKFSKIMRIYLNASINAKVDPKTKEFGMIRLKDELDLIRLFCDLEKLQHQAAFTYTLKVAPNIPEDYYKIPPLIIQPFVENAILHGVLPNKTKVGHIQILLTMDDDETLTCQIIDDGIGRAEAARLKESQTAAHQSFGTELVNSRTEILNKLGANISIQVTDNVPSGTIVTIKHYI